MYFHSLPIASAGLTGAMSHCSTLIELPNGDLLCSWMTGAYEPAPDQHLVVARLARGYAEWDLPIHLPQTGGRPEGQPVFLLDSSDMLWLYHVVNSGTTWNTARIHRRSSADYGHTWSAAECLGFDEGIMLRSRALQLADQRWALPAYDELTWSSFMLISDDDGGTWQKSGKIETEPGNIHPCPVHVCDRQYIAYLRTGGPGGWIWRTASYDGCQTWSPATATAIPNPNSGIDLLRLYSGALVLAFNNSATLRSPICVALSDDNGTTWPHCRTLDDRQGEFSYPTLLQSECSYIELVYTHRRDYICHAHFDEEWLREGCPLQAPLKIAAPTWDAQEFAIREGSKYLLA